MEAFAKFRSRARVIDLLGRQQIADAPTAVGELFKNALDAGARNVWVDFWEEEDVLTVRDDGLGMREEDVLGKWLVLATESRHGKSRPDLAWAKFADTEQTKWLKKPSYGEKGIGRLSVATLGRITLLWTVWGKGKEKQGCLCLVHWNLFQHPFKLFEELPIPLIRLNRAAQPDDVERLFVQLRSSPEVKQMIEDESWDSNLRGQLKSDLKSDVHEALSKTELRWEMGTTFCVLGTTDQVSELFLKGRSDIQPSDDYPPDWLKSFHAFSTFWDPFHAHKDRDFRIHPRLSGKTLSRTYRYWDPSDFKECDHHICVRVSKDGFAKGFVKNYHKAKVPYEGQLKHLPRGHTSPGEFLVEIGYVQGIKADSPLPDDIHAEITKRLAHSGGFSIYLNNVRVQPYGGIDSDFAGFEERRLRNAGRYYFSMRRMFGGIFIPSKEGTGLEEKAGREGFVVNGPRRGLRFWIEDLFVDLADTFFGRNADREDKKKRKREKESAAAKARLEKEKEEYLADVRVHRGWLRDFEQRVKRQVQTSRGLFASEANALPGTYLEECEKALNLLRELAAELRATPSDPPIGVVIEGDALASVDEYLSQRGTAIQNLNKEIANQTKELQSYRLRAKGVAEQEKSIIARIASADAQIKQSIDALLEPAFRKSEHLASDLRAYAAQELKFLAKSRDDVLDGLTIKQISRDTSGELARKLESALQAQLDLFETQTEPRLKRLVNDISHLTDNTSGALVLSEQAEELKILKEREVYLIEMAQLGLILEVANHEHEKQVGCIRSSIEHLEKNVSGQLRNSLQALSDSFEIIDARMRLFDPLIRRRSAVQNELSGEEIEEFLKIRFREEFEIKGFIQVTKSFRACVLAHVKRPVFLGAVHNIFHNALYWCKRETNEPHIRLSASGQILTVSDTGPGISPRDRRRIFEPGFSRRPYGRGLGLFIAREALRGIGFDLYSPEEPELGALSGANFTITAKADAHAE